VEMLAIGVIYRRWPAKVSSFETLPLEM